MLAVGIGGALGTLFRYFININTLQTLYPIGTIIENLIGSFLLGGLTGWLIHRHVKDWMKNGIGVGLCGGFTTMSTFAADTVYLYAHESVTSALVYVVISLFGGICLAMAGYILAEKLNRSFHLSYSNKRTYEENKETEKQTAHSNTRVDKKNQQKTKKLKKHESEVDPS